jgi:hypothetical protein
MTDEEKAQLLVAAIKTELARGTKHYDKDGNFLPDLMSIITALAETGCIVIESSPEFAKSLEHNRKAYTAILN